MAGCGQEDEDPRDGGVVAERAGSVTVGAVAVEVDAASGPVVIAVAAAVGAGKRPVCRSEPAPVAGAELRRFIGVL